jgi:flagellar motor switch protein FliG
MVDMVMGSVTAPPPPRVNSTAGMRHRGEKSYDGRIYTYQEKAAILLTALGAQAAEPILREFRDEDVRAFARASTNLGEVSKRTLDGVIREFLAGLKETRITVSAEKLKEILASVLSEDAIERILEDVDESDGQSIWEKLSRSDPLDLANFLAREHPQTVAVVLSRIRPDTAAKVMQRFELGLAEEVVIRMSMVSALSITVMDAVKSSIEDDFLRGARLKKSKRKPDELIGSMFNFLPGEKRDEIFGLLENSNPELAAAVQKKMFTFNDIPYRVDRANISAIIREVENEALVKALVFADKNSPETRKFILESISRRLAEQFEEQLEVAGPVNAREGEEAQFEVIDTIKRLSDRGELVLRQPDEDDLL